MNCCIALNQLARTKQNLPEEVTNTRPEERLGEELSWQREQHMQRLLHYCTKYSLQTTSAYLDGKN